MFEQQDSITLPKGYARLGFVNSNGKQWNGDAKPLNNAAWVMTNVKQSSTLQVAMDFAVGENQNFQWGDFLGCNAEGFYQGYNYGVRTMNRYDIRFDGATPSSENWAFTIDEGVFYHLTFCPSTLFEIDGVGKKEVVAESRCDANPSTISIGGGHYCYSGTDCVRCGMPALYGMVAFTDIASGILLERYVPAKRKSDGTCGFYETVYGRFCASECSIPFTENGYD